LHKNQNEEKLEQHYWDNVKERGIIRRSEEHPVVQFFSKQRFDYIKSRIDFDSVKTCLDVACGTGYGSMFFRSEKQVIGLDFSRRLLNLNKSKIKVQGSAKLLPFQSNSIDLVCGWDFLHHIDDSDKVIQEMIRVSKKYLVFIEPNRYNPVIFLYALYLKDERGMLKYCKSNLNKMIKSPHTELIFSDTIQLGTAGGSPEFTLSICKRLPFITRFGAFVVSICKKKYC